jgi:hypothetical protein
MLSLDANTGLLSGGLWHLSFMRGGLETDRRIRDAKVLADSAGSIERSTELIRRANEALDKAYKVLAQSVGLQTNHVDYTSYHRNR